MKNVIVEKQKNVDTIVSEIDKAKSFIIFEYKGLSAESLNALRKKMTNTNSKMIVLKNNILIRAFAKKTMKDFENLLVGPNAIAFAFEDEMSVFKHIFNLNKQFEFIKIKGGYFNNKFVDANQIKTIAAIPGREELYGMLLSCLTSPIRSVLYGLKAIESTKQQ